MSFKINDGLYLARTKKKKKKKIHLTFIHANNTIQ